MGLFSLLAGAGVLYLDRIHASARRTSRKRNSALLHRDEGPLLLAPRLLARIVL